MRKWHFISGWGHGRKLMSSVAEAMGCSRFSVSSLADLDQGDGVCPDYAGNLAVNLQKKGADQVILVGWSTGGMIALETAWRQPEKISGLVLISTTPHFCWAADFPWGAEEAALRAMKLGVRGKFHETLADFRQRSAWPRQLTREQIQAAVAEAEEQGKFSLERGLTYLRQTDLRPHLEKVTVPCLLLHGKSDCIVSWKATEWMNSKIKNSRCRIWPDEGHDLVKGKFPELIEELNLIKLFAENAA